MKPKIYFVCPNNKFISGGVKQIYRQVEILNKNGITSYVLLEGKSKQRWFDNQASITYSPYLFKILKYKLQDRKIGLTEKIKLWFLKKKSVCIEENAILVFPEIYGDKIDKIFPGIKKVIFNQNCYYTFNQYAMDKDYEQTPYHSKDILATIVVSEDSQAYLSYTFPTIKIYRTTIGIPHSIFNYSDKKEQQICFMPRKLKEDVIQVLHILKQRGVLGNWKLVPIDNKTEIEVAEIMKRSIFFLSFNHREGFGLPPVEAMSCGCYVIGYHGEAGREYLKTDFSTSVENGNIVAYAQEVEKAIALYEKEPEIILTKGKMASEYVQATYSIEIEERETIKIWDSILKLAING